MNSGHGQRQRFVAMLRRLAPSSDQEADAISNLIAVLVASGHHDDVHRCRLALRDALLLASWQSPSVGERSASGTLQGPGYASRYERETIDVSLLETTLADAGERVLVFKCPDSAQELIANVSWLQAPPPSSLAIDSVPVLDSELGVVRWRTADDPSESEWVERLKSARKIGALPSLSQVYSAYLEFEILPSEALWHSELPKALVRPAVRALRANAFATSWGKDAARLAEECAYAIAETHSQYIPSVDPTSVLLTSSGMAALAAIISRTHQDEQTVGRRVAIGRSAYYENREAVASRFSNKDIHEYHEDDPTTVLDTAFGTPALVLVEPVSNSASTTYVSRFTGWAPSSATDMAVCSIPSLLDVISSQPCSTRSMLAIDASLSGPGPWLEPIVEAAETSGVEVFLWSSLQKHFMSGEDWSTGGFILRLGGHGPIIPGCEFGTPSFVKTLTPAAMCLVIASASEASARAQRLGDASAWLAQELQGLLPGVIHPALASHQDHRAWIASRRPPVPFVFVRLGHQRAASLRTALLESSPAGNSGHFLERDSFGFGEPSISDVFPGQPDEILRVSPGDPEHISREEVLEIFLRAAEEAQVDSLIAWRDDLPLYWGPSASNSDEIASSAALIQKSVSAE